MSWSASLLVWIILAQATPPPKVDCYALGVKATQDGRLDAALGAFQAAFAHPACREQRGGLLLNMGVTLEGLGEAKGDLTYTCAAALRYRAVIDESATPEMLSAASLGAQRALQLCGREPASNEEAFAQSGAAEVIGDGRGTGLAIGLTVGAGAGVLSGVVMFLLAERNVASYNTEAAKVTAAPDYAALQTRVNNLAKIQDTITSQRTAGGVLIGAGVVLGLGALWAWIDASGSAPVIAPKGDGLVIGGTF